MTTALDVLPQPVQWAELGLRDIDEVEPVNEGDYDCLREVRDVLKRHGKQERFGVALLHKHFDMADDELLIEYSDPAARVLTIKPVKQAAAGRTVETIWILGDGENRVMLGCRQYCGADVHGNHNSFHRQT
jgi:hypothetical protein